MIRGIRGATTVNEDNESQVLQATKELVEKLIETNNINAENVAHVYITVTHDLVSTFPAKVLREIEGWKYVPVICSQEIPVPGSIEKCIRLLLTVNTKQTQQEVVHVYLNNAVKLRPDLHLTSE